VKQHRSTWSSTARSEPARLTYVTAGFSGRALGKVEPDATPLFQIVPTPGPALAGVLVSGMSSPRAPARK